MTDFDITTEATTPQEWRDVDYVQINCAAQTVSNSSITAYWLNSYGERTAHHDQEILTQIDKIAALTVLLRAKIEAAQ